MGEQKKDISQIDQKECDKNEEVKHKHVLKYITETKKTRSLQIPDCLIGLVNKLRRRS